MLRTREMQFHRQRRYYARLRQRKANNYTYFALNAKTEDEACEEAFHTYAKYAVELKEGRDVGKRHRKIEFFIEEFLQHQETRARDKLITEKRVDVLKHSLASLSRFSAEHKNPALDDLIQLYELHWHEYRGEQTRQIAGRDSGRPLSARFRNIEIATHKQFFIYCLRQKYCSAIPTVEALALQRVNEPFPKKYYPGLLAAARNHIATTTSVKSRWSLLNYYFIIRLMNNIGCRVVEIKNMRWEHIQKTPSGTYMFIHGKGKERTIQITENVANFLNDLKQTKQRLGKGWWSETTHPFIFNAYKKATVTQNFQPICKKRWMVEAGVPNPGDYQLVCFRHKFITEALNNGVHSLTVAKYVGTSQAMIEKTYSGLVAGDVFKLMYQNAPEAALQGRNTAKWLNDLE